jgi:hypothetical protein
MDGPFPWGILIPITGMMIPIVAILARVMMRAMEVKERQITAMGENTAEKAAQYVSRVSELEQRVRVLERIVTDGGMHTAAQIEALREAPATSDLVREKVL